MGEQNKGIDSSEKEDSEIPDGQDLDDNISLPPESDPRFLFQKLDEAQIPDELKSQLKTGINGIVLRSCVTREIYSMQGMLPPKKLKEFDEVLEKGSERVFAEITRQTHHRQYLVKNNC